MMPIATPVRFSSTIRFVTRADFLRKLGNKDQMIDDGQCADWGCDSPAETIGRRVRLKTKGFTEGAYDCNIHGVHNRVHLSLSHIHPLGAQDYPGHVREALINDMVRLKQEGEPLRAFITGGRAYQDGGRYKPSKKLFNMLRKILKEAGVSAVSIIWGRTSEIDNGSTNVFYDTAEDTYYVYAESGRKRHVRTWADLRQTFKVIRIAPGDTLVLKNCPPIEGPFDAAKDPSPKPETQQKPTWWARLAQLLPWGR